MFEGICLVQSGKWRAECRNPSRTSVGLRAGISTCGKCARGQRNGGRSHHRGIHASRLIPKPSAPHAGLNARGTEASTASVIWLISLGEPSGGSCAFSEQQRQLTIHWLGRNGPASHMRSREAKSCSAASAPNRWPHWGHGRTWRPGGGQVSCTPGTCPGCCAAQTLDPRAIPA